MLLCYTSKNYLVIRHRYSTFHHYPCLWLAKVVEAVLKHDRRDVIIITVLLQAKEWGHYGENTYLLDAALFLSSRSHSSGDYIIQSSWKTKCGVVGKGRNKAIFSWGRHGHIREFSRKSKNLNRSSILLSCNRQLKVSSTKSNDWSRISSGC